MAKPRMSTSPHLVDLLLPQLRELRQRFEVRGPSQTVDLVLGDEAPADRQLDRGTPWRSTDSRRPRAAAVVPVNKSE